MNKSPLSLAKRFKRYDARTSGIAGRIADRDDSVLRNISVGGASFIVDRPIKARSSCSVDIEAGGKTLNIKGRVVWSRSVVSETTEDHDRRGPYTIGVMFNNSNYNETGRLLAELLESLDPPFERSATPPKVS